MSIATSALSEAPLCADSAPPSSTSTPPPHRRTAAKPDGVVQPEAR